MNKKLRLFTFEIKVEKINGLGVSGDHDVFVVANNMTEALEIFNNDFKNDSVVIQTTHQSPCKVLINRGQDE